MDGLAEFRRRFFALAATYPRLARGGLNRDQLRDLAIRIGRRMGYHVEVLFAPWPWPASITRIGHLLVIAVDNRPAMPRQVSSLAHEVAHLALGHYRLQGFWADADGPRAVDEERWADYFAGIVLDKLLTPLDHLGGEQLEFL